MIARTQNQLLEQVVKFTSIINRREEIIIRVNKDSEEEEERIQSSNNCTCVLWKNQWANHMLNLNSTKYKYYIKILIIFLYFY